MIEKDCSGDEILKYCGGYTHYNKTSQPFTYSIAKVAIENEKKYENERLNVVHKYEYRLYAYHGLTFDCYTKGFIVAKVEDKGDRDKAENFLRSVAMHNDKLEDWEKTAIKSDYILYSFLSE